MNDENIYENEWAGKIHFSYDLLWITERTIGKYSDLKRRKSCYFIQFLDCGLCASWLNFIRWHLRPGKINEGYVDEYFNSEAAVGESQCVARASRLRDWECAAVRLKLSPRVLCNASRALIWHETNGRQRPNLTALIKFYRRL